MQTLRWLRVPGDTIFALGAIALVLFIIGLSTGRSFRPDSPTGPHAEGQGRATPRERDAVLSR